VYGGVLLVATNVLADCTSTPSSCQLDKPSVLGIPQLSVTNVFTDVISVFSFVAGVLSAIFLVIGGIRYTTSGGNSQRVESAKQTILYAVIGLIVSVLAFAIVDFIVSRSP
jgi:hypothetical protein